jgi:L-ascorbate metabolism protein UlaG (beta-lactamase superfamily)
MVSRFSRRAVLGGVGIAGAAGIAGLMYQAAPTFWRQFVKELGRPILPPPRSPDPARWPDTGLHAAWIGHATVLIKVDGYTIITDPVLTDRIGINLLGPLTLGLKRLVAPALAPERAPRPDLILLSHAHMDHFDIPTLRRLESKQTVVVTASATSDLLRPARYRAVRELGWGERTQAGPVSIRAFRVKHWGARLRRDTHRGYNGYAIEAGRWRILFAGDTAETDDFRRLRGPKEYHLAIMPIGAYNPWIRNHCTPEQAWRMGNDAGSEHFIPIHHQTFQLSREPVHEPIERFQNAAGNHQSRILVRTIGEEIHLS